MTKSISDRDGTRWTVQAVGPYGIGPRPLRPHLWDLVFRSDSGERVSVPIVPGALDTMTDDELVAALENARKRSA